MERRSTFGSYVYIYRKFLKKRTAVETSFMGRFPTSMSAVPDISVQIDSLLRQRLKFPISVEFARPNRDFRRTAQATGIAIEGFRIHLKIEDDGKMHTQTTWANSCALLYTKEHQMHYMQPNAYSEIVLLDVAPTVPRLRLMCLLPPSVREVIRGVSPLSPPMEAQLNQWLKRMQCEDWAEQICHETYQRKPRKRTVNEAAEPQPKRLKTAPTPEPESKDPDMASELQRLRFFAASIAQVASQPITDEARLSMMCLSLMHIPELYSLCPTISHLAETPNVDANDRVQMIASLVLPKLPKQ